METQTKQILQYMIPQPITAIDALQYIGSFRLAARIKNLRDEGHDIHTEIITTNIGAKIASYSLIKEKE